MEISKAEIAQLSSKLKTYKKKQKLSNHAKIALFPKETKTLTKEGFVIKVLDESQKAEKFTKTKSMSFYDEMMNRHTRKPFKRNK
ncbi:unnamed protein product [Blepharisma stoltei]|uniref:Uncharacterized protein n=1 Tax=Blepharisma stoltei TaxID=1481888 RepID=A0AAU9IWK5_9CILI|nr:unnamed protein product [Blepharisma stoltei]